MVDLSNNLEKFLAELEYLLNKTLINKEMFEEEKNKAVKAYLKQMREKYNFKGEFKDLFKPYSPDSLNPFIPDPFQLYAWICI